MMIILMRVIIFIMEFSLYLLGCRNIDNGALNNGLRNGIFRIISSFREAAFELMNWPDLITTDVLMTLSQKEECLLASNSYTF
jgi:hypothetical protein